MHFIDEKVDEGKIIATDWFCINYHDTAEKVFRKANEIGLELLVSNFENLITDSLQIKEERKNKKTYTYRKKDLKHEINLEDLCNEEFLYRELRSLAFDKMPSPFIVLQGKKVYLKLEEYDDGVLKKNEK
jgi:methionyl-tRNA formyltransferase